MVRGTLTASSGSPPFTVESKTTLRLFGSRGELRLGAVLVVPGLYSRLWLHMARVGALSGVLHSRLWLFQALLGAPLVFLAYHFVTSLRSSLVLRPLLYWSRALVFALFVLLLTRVDCLRGTLPFLRFSKTARDVTTLSLGGGVSLGFSCHPDAGEGLLDSSLVV